jgi:hypothetical protein
MFYGKIQTLSEGNKYNTKEMDMIFLRSTEGKTR